VRSTRFERGWWRIWKSEGVFKWLW